MGGGEEVGGVEVGNGGDETGEFDAQAAINAGAARDVPKKLGPDDNRGVSVQYPRKLKVYQEWCTKVGCNWVSRKNCVAFLVNHKPAASRKSQFEGYRSALNLLVGTEWSKIPRNGGSGVGRRWLTTLINHASASNASRRMETQAAPAGREFTATQLKKRERHATKDAEVQALRGDEGLRAEAVVARSGGPARIDDTHAGGGGHWALQRAHFARCGASWRQRRADTMLGG